MATKEEVLAMIDAAAFVKVGLKTRVGYLYLTVSKEEARRKVDEIAGFGACAGMGNGHCADTLYIEA